MSMVINSALYRNGKRERDLSVEAISDVLHTPGSFVWLGLHEPDNAMLDLVQEEFGLHDLAIEDEGHVACGVQERLLARGHVDHGQAAVAHAQGFFQIQLAFVGTAMVLAFVHAPQRFAVDLPGALGVKDSDYSAHDLAFLLVLG